ncbi:MAG: hypothetical protein KAR20_08485 [Candidatus Heimdallarchaeota archaeon]|nr:hypothetical protein [Candidatus Heimdallarchaeota archaeon]
MMKASLFNFPIEIREVEWPWTNKATPENVFSLLETYFSHLHEDRVRNKSQYLFHEVTRPDFGLVHPVITVSPLFPTNEGKRSDYFTIRIYQKPSSDLHMAFNLADHHKTRIEQLIDALGPDHYPETYFLESNDILIVLQPFLFHPVCDYSKEKDIYNLIELLFLASKALILLDYNHNHFLRAEEGPLFYVDTDYMGVLCSSEFNALHSNLNQSMIFINEENAPFIPKELMTFSTLNEETLAFSRLLLTLLNEYVSLCHTDEVKISSKLMKKINAIAEILPLIKIH